MLTATNEYDLGFQEYNLGYSPKVTDSEDYWRGYFDAYNADVTS